MLLGSTAFANFVSAKVKVTGVTCSMCSNSVHKALSSLSFIGKIDVDLENAEFMLTFKPNEKVNIDAIKEKIEGAGFSVGQLIANFAFNNVEINKDFHYQYADNTYHFVDVKNQKLNNTVAIRFVDKGLTSNKEHKKYVGLTSYQCIKSGKSENCCNAVSKKRIYHVTL
ncbi:MAG: Heavy metal transport/detoxification protein [Bacteroidetes bacterium]|jgi:copper chaperone CopZ|nr:Heavy metal transport/detoxification protein [Bacteroidota bacterium]